MLAYRDGAVLPFVALQTRLGRKSPSAAIRDRCRSSTSRSTCSRSAAAATEPGRAAARPAAGGAAPPPRGLGLPLAEDGGAFALSHLVSAASVDDLEAAFGDARGRRNEGLMVKDPTSGYSPGRRGLGWLKMKKALATHRLRRRRRRGRPRQAPRRPVGLHVRRSRRAETGKLVTIGKAYSGLTDAEIAEMTAWFEAHTLERFGRYRAGRADRRRRGRVRRHRPVDPPSIRLCAPLPADRRAPARQDRPTRSTRSRRVEASDEGSSTAPSTW